MIYLESSPALKDGWVEKLSFSFIDDDKSQFEEMIIWSIKERKQ